MSEGKLDYHALNAMLNLYDQEGKINLEADRKAVKQYFLDHVNQNTVFFHSLSEKLEYLVEEGYYEQEVLDQYPTEFIASIWDTAFRKKFRFRTFLGAFKYYTSYTLKTRDGKRFLERYEDRVVMTALYLARGDQELAMNLMHEIIDGKFQPATPTFLNAGKKARGELVSCFPAGTKIDTANGQMNIENISVGERVLTEDGKFNEVIALNKRKYRKKLISLKFVGVPTIEVTPEHPFLVRNRMHDTRISVHDYHDDAFKWIMAKDLEAQIDEAVIHGEEGEKSFAMLEASHESDDEYDDFVYNIQVRNNPTYSVNGVVVHNCFLLRVEDSMESISRGLNSALQLSKRGGGVALLLSNLRELGAPIKGIEGACSGVVPVMKMLEDAFSYANQLGARQGAGAVYLNAHHPDIMRFLDTKRENADEKIRIKTLSLGVVIPNITFELAKRDEDMYLFSPHDVEKVYGKAFGDISVTEKYYEMLDDKRIRKTKINARGFFQTLAEIQFESGYPYVMFEDTVNAANPIEGRVNMSNLCVHGETKILTDKGHVKISEVAGSKQNVWNGKEYSEVDVVQTGHDKKLLRVTLSNGAHLDCTPEHKFYVNGNDGSVEVRAGELKNGQTLIPLETSVIEGTKKLEKAYVLGVTSFVSKEDFSLPEDGPIAQYVLRKVDPKIKQGLSLDDWINEGEREIMNDLFSFTRDKPRDFVPGTDYDVQSRLKWFSGVVDIAGRIHSDSDHNTLRIGYDDESLLNSIRFMLQTLGVKSGVFESGAKGRYLLIIDASQVKRLMNVGFISHKIDLSKFSAGADENEEVFVMDVTELTGVHDTFCFTEPKRHMGVFNGILTGQCSEILQINEASTYHNNLDYDHTGIDISCNLGSMNIAKAMDGGNLGRSVETAIRALNAVSEQSNIDSVPSIQKGNDEGHAIGLGQMNLHGFLARERIHYDSEEAVDFTSVYFATVLFHALRASNLIAKERGTVFKGFERSKYADGTFFEKYTERDWVPKTSAVERIFFDCGINVPTREDWAELRDKVMADGLYNRNLQAVPPTGSISYINDSTSSIHPIVSKIEIRKEGKIGRVYYPAPFMTNDNVEYYRDAYELGYKPIIDVYAAATEHVDQGLSLTLFFPADVSTRDLNKAQIYAWKKGIKTIYYVRLRQAALEGTEVEGCVSCTL